MKDETQLIQVGVAARRWLQLRKILRVHAALTARWPIVQHYSAIYIAVGCGVWRRTEHVNMRPSSNWRDDFVPVCDS